MRELKIEIYGLHDCRTTFQRRIRLFILVQLPQPLWVMAYYSATFPPGFPRPDKIVVHFLSTLLSDIVVQSSVVTNEVCSDRNCVGCGFCALWFRIFNLRRYLSLISILILNQLIKLITDSLLRWSIPACPLLRSMSLSFAHISSKSVDLSTNFHTPCHLLIKFKRLCHINRITCHVAIFPVSTLW